MHLLQTGYLILKETCSTIQTLSNCSSLNSVGKRMVVRIYDMKAVWYIFDTSVFRMCKKSWRLFYSFLKLVNLIAKVRIFHVFII